MRILVVDDDSGIRDFLKSNLENLSFAVDTAGNGDEASYMARTCDYDLIILDYVMPRKNGLEVCRDVRAHGKNTPILMLSVQADVEDKVALFRAGVDDYVTKPFSWNELDSRIRTLLRRPRHVLDAILKISDFEIDTVRQKVTRGKKDIYLTRKEYALAEYLMRNKGMTLSRGVLMEHVWNSEVDPFSNTVETHILNIRKKIDGGAKKKIIHTVPGRGYKIDSHRTMID